ncbi:hypothetical protein GCM10009839_24690 [Catenulispora yoronensis]|uniref:YCII-related domain-containing protein n=1 Tax=Catenulispora yoronensis TaxID=450799 RepID=A0ABP5FFI3_9ACTN
MELVLVVLTAPTPQARTPISPQVLTDILWANATPADGLQHISVRTGPDPRDYVIGLFLLPADTDVAERALRICQQAVHAAPALNNWTVARLRISSASARRRPQISPTRPDQ